jgi:uncharacterized membrane protein YhaH (DUF805 family)
MPTPATTDQILRFFFRIDGRIGRQEYALGIGVVYSLNLAILVFLLTRTEITPATLTFLTILSIPILVGLIVVMAKRCHDLGLPGSFFLLALVPFIGLFWPFALAFLPGNPGPNSYGPPPAFEPE